MKTMTRVCIQDHTVMDREGTSFTVHRAKEYITSQEHTDGSVTVYSTFWVRVPVSIFAGEQRFT